MARSTAGINEQNSKTTDKLQVSFGVKPVLIQVMIGGVRYYVLHLNIDSTSVTSPNVDPDAAWFIHASNKYKSLSII